MYLFHALIITLIYLTDLVLLVPKYTACKYDHTPRNKKLVWKGLCIGLPFLILVTETVFRLINGTSTVTNLLIIAGMLFCGVGDIVLEIRFIKGGVLFFLGHVFYVAALFTLQDGLCAISIIMYLALVITGTILTLTRLSKKYRPFLITYNLIISGSFALSLPVMMTGEPALVLLGTGACFLVASDWLLARNKYYGSTYQWSLISLILYFGGQMLISSYAFLM